MNTFGFGFLLGVLLSGVPLALAIAAVYAAKRERKESEAEK